MSFFASVNGLQIVSGRLLRPLVGLWTADLTLASATALSGQVTVVIGNLSLLGTVYRSQAYGGQTKCRLVAGYGGWRTEVASQGYGHSNGLQLSTVLNDAAGACGEQVSLPVDVTIGKAYTRAGMGVDAVASDVLWLALALGYIPGWYVDATGVTQCQAWPSTAVSTPFTVTHQNPDEGLVEIATEDYVSWAPGCTFTNPLLDGSYTSGGVHYVWDDDGKFRFEVLTGTDDRFLGELEAFIARQVSPTRWLGRYAYVISNPSTTTVDAAPKNPKIGLPSLQSVPLVGDSVSTYTPPDGGACHIQFLDGDPAQPICVWTDQAPTMASLLGGTNPVARLGDQVQVFLPPGLPVVLATSVGPATGAITAGGPISGAIVQGSQQVNSA